MLQSRQREDDRVEGRIWKLERLGVAQAEIGSPPEHLGPLPGDIEHRGAQLDPGQPHAFGIVGKVATGPYRDLQDVAPSLSADPSSSIPKQELLDQADPPVIPRRHPIVDLSDPFVPHSLHRG
jgi:hypothetical protein